MSKPQMKNGARHNRTRKSALRPLVKTLRKMFRAKKSPGQSLHTPLRTIRFETIEPRLMLSADAPISIDGPDNTPAGFEHTLTSGINVSFDVLTAVNDTGAAKEDDPAPATGNVLDNDGAPSGPLTVAQPGVFEGSYGTLTLGEDGGYSYLLNNDSLLVQGLHAGEVVTDSFSYMATDGVGLAAAQLTIAITGVNDVPMPADTFAYTAEDMLPTAAGNVLVIAGDNDFGTVLAIAQPGTYTGVYGTLTLSADGNFQYLLDNESAAVQGVGPNGMAQDVFDFSISDGIAAAPARLTILVLGMNDAPVAMSDDAAIEEGSVLPVLGNVLTNDSDIDAGSALSVTAPGVYQGTYGALVLNADGTYAYHLANGSSAVQALREGEMVQDVFAYTATDGAEESTGFLLVSVTGRNNAPAATDNTAAVVEDGLTTASGNVLSDDSDADTDTMLRIAAPGVYTGVYGALTLNQDGSFTYTLANQLPAVQALRAGETVQDDFSFVVTDGIALTPSRLVVVVHGRNDGAVVADDAAQVSEDGVLLATGNVLSNDRDGNGGSNLTVFGPGFYAGVYGNLTLASDGSFSYALNNGSAAVQALAAGDTVTDLFTYTAFDGIDGVPAKLTITVAGANDGPRAQDDAGAANEDGGAVTFNAAALLGNDHDPDQGDSLAIVAVSNSGAGVQVRLVNGNVVYDIGNLFQNLAQGEQFTDSFSYTVADAAGALATARVVVTVTGGNDGPVAQASTVTGQEDTPYVFAWSDFGAADIDNGAALDLTILALPWDGQLQYRDGANWSAVAIGQRFTRAAVEAGGLRFAPDANESGSPAYAQSGYGNRMQHYAQFVYQIGDGAAQSERVGMTIDIAPAVDVPALTVASGGAGPATELFRTGWESVANKNTNATLVRGAALEGWMLVSNKKSQQGFEIFSTGDRMADGKGGPSTVAADAGNGKNWLRVNSRDTLGIQRIVTTGAGAIYNLSFDYAGHVGAAAAATKIAIYVDGVRIATHAATSPEGKLSWQRINFQFVGKGGAQTIRIVSEPATASANGGAMIDDIVLTEAFPLNSGAANTPIRLSGITAALSDTDGSEQLAVRILAIPVGATLTDGVRTFTATAGATVADVTAWNLANLSIRPPQNFTGAFTLQVAAVATELATGQTAVNSVALTVTVKPQSTPSPGPTPGRDDCDFPVIDWSSLGLDGISGSAQYQEWLEEFLGAKRKLIKDVLKTAGLKIKL